MARLDFSMFTKSGLFKIDGDSRTHKMTYRGRWQCLEVYHNFLDYRNRNRNDFYMRGINDYDRMEVRTVEDMRAVAVLMGYDDEILEVIDNLGKE